METITDTASGAIETIARPAQAKGASATVKHLFLLLQGRYGTLFLSKYGTGVKDDAGRDLGIRAAMLVWDADLARYPADVIEAAAKRSGSEYRDYPPNLPQFVALCDAIMPRKTWAQEQGLPRLPPPATPQALPVHVDAHRDGRDWARRILARRDHGERISRTCIAFACEALRLPPPVAARKA